MDRIWAPWRKKYVSTHARGPGCFLCRARRSPANQDPKNFLLHRSSKNFIVLNRYPYTNGHLMIVSNRHVPSLEKLNDAERLDLLRLLDRALASLRKSLHPEGFNLGMNFGRAGGAGVPGHVHIHVVPRWPGDTNFMPLLTGSKVISDSLEGTYGVLRRFFKR